MDKSNEVLKGVSARIGLAINLLEKGAVVDAHKMLQKMLPTLPNPDKRNIEAALASIKE